MEQKLTYTDLYYVLAVTILSKNIFFLFFNGTINIALLLSSAFNSVFSGTPTNIRIAGIGDHVMAKIIDYAYLRSCDLTEENVFEILVIADYLALRSLMDFCIQFLVDHLKPENCINVMRFAL